MGTESPVPGVRDAASLYGRYSRARKENKGVALMGVEKDLGPPPVRLGAWLAGQAGG